MAGKKLFNFERLVLREGGFDAASSPIDCDEASNCIKKINSEVEQGFNDCSLEELREKLSSLLGSKERRNEKDFEVTILSFPSAPDDDVSEYYYRSREDEPAEDLDSVLIDAFDFTESEEEDDPYGLEDFMNNFQKDSSDSSYCFSIPAASSTPSSSHYSLLSSSPKASTSSSLSSPSAFSLAVEKVPEIQTIEALDSTSCCTIPLLPSLPQHLSFNFCQDPLDDILYHTLSSEVFNSSSSSKILNGAEDYGVDTDTLKQALNVSAVISEIGIEDKKDCSFTSTGIPLISSIAEIRYDQDHDGMSCDVGGVLPEVDDLAHWLKGKRNAVIDNAYLGEDSRTKTLGSPVGVLKEQDHDAVLRSENDCGGSLNTNSSVDKKPESACRYAKSAVKDVSRMTEDAVSLTEAAVQTECSAIGPFSLLNLEIGAVMLEALDSATKTDEKNDGGSVVDPTWMVSPLESVEGDSIFLPEKEPYTNAIDANQAEDGRIEYFDALPNSAINLHALAISKADRAMAAMVNSGSEVSAHKVQHNTILRTPPAPLITTEYIDAEIMKALPSLSVGSHGNHRSLKMKLAVDQEMERIARIMLQRRTPIASRIV